MLIVRRVANNLTSPQQVVGVVERPMAQNRVAEGAGSIRGEVKGGVTPSMGSCIPLPSGEGCGE